MHRTEFIHTKRHGKIKHCANINMWNKTPPCIHKQPTPPNHPKRSSSFSLKWWWKSQVTALGSFHPLLDKWLHSWPYQANFSWCHTGQHWPASFDPCTPAHTGSHHSRSMLSTGQRTGYLSSQICCWASQPVTEFLKGNSNCIDPVRTGHLDGFCICFTWHWGVSSMPHLPGNLHCPAIMADAFITITIPANGCKWQLTGWPSPQIAAFAPRKRGEAACDTSPWIGTSHWPVAVDPTGETKGSTGLYTGQPFVQCQGAWVPIPMPSLPSSCQNVQLWQIWLCQHWHCPKAGWGRVGKARGHCLNSSSHTQVAWAKMARKHIKFPQLSNHLGVLRSKTERKTGWGENHPQVCLQGVPLFLHTTGVPQQDSPLHSQTTNPTQPP